MRFTCSKIWLFSLLALGFLCYLGECMTLFGSLNGNGVRGTITWIQESLGSRVTVLVSLEALLGTETADFSWAIHEFPVNYGSNPSSKCDRNVLGPPILKMDEVFGKLTLPAESTISLSTDRFNLTGPGGIWFRSIVLTNKGISTCATVEAEGESRLGVAHFTSPMAGSVYFYSLAEDRNKAGVTTAIFSDIFHVNQERPASSDHSWKIFISDYSSSTKELGNCNSLQLLWDPENKQVDGDCSKTRPEECAAGDLSEKHEKLRVGARQSLFSRKMYIDSALPTISYEGRRKLYLVIFHPDKSDTIVACARIQKVEPKRAIALVHGFGAKVNFTFVQSSPFHPTDSMITARNLAARAGLFHVHVLPKTAKLKAKEDVCGTTGGHWNPYQVNMANYPQPAAGSDDQFELGDLSGKYGSLTGLDNVTSVYSDTNLPLFGSNSIIGRSIVIHSEADGRRWICGNIVNTRKVIMAAATFRYPLVGSIYFIQEANNPYSETTIFINGLHYSDGSKNDTLDHQWYIHTGEISKDFYDWRNRCMSAGPHFNPFKVNTESRGYSDCGPSSPLRCELGDISTRLQKISVSGTKNRVPYTRRLFTDLNLPLSGPASILGKSIVINDDNFPIHRGDRLACNPIHRVYRVKAVAKNWFSNGEKIGLTGKLEFIQETPFAPVKYSVDLKGLGGNVQNYHIHKTSIPIDRSTPCSEHSVGLNFDPFNITKSPVAGTEDQYEVGDLSGKFGSLTNLQEFEDEYNDTNLELSAPHSILGRSIVIHKKDRDVRWACADVVRGYSPSEADEYRAIASFHHPNGYVWGYVRFSQLVYNDGSLSDTTIEINLKYPGNVNRNATRGHRWSIYVNRIAHDVAVRSLSHRCVAAGIRWNPYFVHLADPNNVDFYSQECSPESPLRCDVGDISGRLGPINIGENKYVFTDPNLPLSGMGSVLHRSLIIHAPNGAQERLSCANIDPDKDIIKYANIRKLSSFLIEDFIDEVREVLGVPEWMLTHDNRQTKDIYDGDCVQLLFHFRGPIADKIEQDFDRLLNGRDLPRPSLDIPGVLTPTQRKTKLRFRSCSSPTSRRNPAKQNLEEPVSSSALASTLNSYFILSNFLIPFLGYLLSL